MKEEFNSLTEEYEEETRAKIENTIDSSCFRIDFQKGTLPKFRKLGDFALKHGFIVSSVESDNSVADDGTVTIWFEPFSVRKETRTVEVEKEVTIIRERGNEYVIHD